MEEITRENVGVRFGGKIPLHTEIYARERNNGRLIVGNVKSCELHTCCITVIMYNLHYEKSDDILYNLLPARIDEVKEYSTSSYILYTLNYKQDLHYKQCKENVL